MNIRERFHATCNFEKVDRPVRRETIGYFPETFERWHGEGLPESVSDDIFSAPLHFQFDNQCWLPVTADVAYEPGFWPRFEDEIIEEDGQFIIKRDLSGSTVRVLADGRSTIPQVIDNPVKSLRDFEDLKWRLDPENQDRFTGFLDVMVNIAKSIPDKITASAVCGLFGTYRHLMGFKGMSIALKKNPELLHAIARQWVHLNGTMVKKLHEREPIDYIYFWEDMAYRNGPMISPRAFREFMAPYYREIIDSIKSDTDIRFFLVDSDGDMWTLTPLFIEVGINMMLPFEVNAGMDIRRVREEFGRDLVIWGGIDKMALFEDEDSIRREVMEKVPPLLEGGGYIPALDHVVPPEVSLENYEKFLEILRELR
jgi:uroporphyrinogen-III decarboxylase